MHFRLATPAAVVAAWAALAAAGPATAGTVLSVGPEGAQHVTDPYLPGAAGELVAPRSGRARVTARAATTKRGQRAVVKALRSALGKRQIKRSSYDKYRARYTKARQVRKRLKGLRGRELGAVIAQLEGIALRKQLTATRMPALFLILSRNTQFWPSRVIPTSRSHIKFRGSELIWEYYSGSGIQLQPLVNFKLANNLHGACVKPSPLACKPGTLKKLLRELIATRSRRGGFTTWEYYFPFGGGQPPWMSGMAESVAIVAFGRASQLFKDPAYLPYARAGFKAFTTKAPTGVLTTGFRGGPHYLQYSFAPRSFIFNAFTQAALGLFDFAELTGDATARRLFDQADPELRRELPYSDIGDWSLYEYRGRAADQQYHELLRELMRSACNRLHSDPFCSLAKTYRRYQTEPGVLTLLGPQTATKGKETRVRFSVSKLSAVEIKITKEGKTAINKIATFRRGNGSFAWKPKTTGTYTVKLGSKELRTGQGLKTKTSGPVEVAAP